MYLSGPQYRSIPAAFIPAQVPGILNSSDLNRDEFDDGSQGLDNNIVICVTSLGTRPQQCGILSII